jgi:uncharacterized protein with GYD domain
VLLTRLTPETVGAPRDLKTLEKSVAERIRRDVPRSSGSLNLAVLGPYDYLDLFEAPDEASAAKVAMIIRSFGRPRRGSQSLGSGSAISSPGDRVGIRGDQLTRSWWYGVVMGEP